MFCDGNHPWCGVLPPRLPGLLFLQVPQCAGEDGGAWEEGHRDDDHGQLPLSGEMVFSLYCFIIFLLHSGKHSKKESELSPLILSASLIL